MTGVRCRAGDGWVRVLLASARNPAIEVEDALRKGGLFERAFRSKLDLSWSQPRAAAPPRPRRPARGAA